MSRTESLLNIGIIPGALIGIFNQQPNRRSCGLAFKHTGQDANFIGLTTLCSKARSARFAAVKITLQIGFRQLNPRRTPINDGTQTQTMTFPKGGHGE